MEQEDGPDAGQGDWGDGENDYWVGTHDRTRIADISIPAGGLAALVQAALEGLAEDDSLFGILSRLNTGAYTLALQHEVGLAGGDALMVQLTNADALGGIEERASWSTSKIIQTFQRDLLRFVATAEENGATEADLPGLIAQWNLTRSSWKDAQIAITESAYAAGQAQKDFIRKSGATGKAYFGNSLQCEICQQVATGNPYDIKDPMVGGIFHVNELDYWRLEYDETTSPWLGD